MNDAAWERLFEKYHILDAISQDGFFPISAAQIKEFREPRLMTKFDHKINLPAIFAANRLAILPVTRGDYVISSFLAYQEFAPPSGTAQRVSIPPYLQSLTLPFLVSESIALNCAHACGLLADFLEDSDILPTVSGRMSSGRFAFGIGTGRGIQRVEVNNAQIEIDAAYEGVQYLSLFEAKRDMADDFLIRQLYYPFRVWRDRMAKPVKPVFLVFSNGVFHLYQYQFDEPEQYNSLRLVKQKSYAIETNIYLPDIEELLRTVPVSPEPPLSFPQANRMARLVNLMELLYEKAMTRQDITSEYAFDERQTRYYTDAGRYLELMEKGLDEEKNIVYRLSRRGRHIMGLPYRERQLAIITQILRHKAFRDTLLACLRRGNMPDTHAIVRIMKGAGLYNVGADSTYARRSSTIVGWVNWILGLLDDGQIRWQFLL